MRILDLLSASSGAALLPLADAVGKATIVLAVAGLLSIALRRRSAAARHLIWTLALMSALVLPVLSIALPKWQVGLVTVPVTSFQLPVASTQLRAVEPLTANREVRTGNFEPDAATNEPRSSHAEPRTASREPRSSRAMPTISWPGALLAIWLLGLGAILARLAIGLIAVQWMSRRTERVTDAPWLPQARALAAELGISARIVFLRSGRAAMPMAWGIFRPAVLMPSDADHWPAERLRIVLLHELAHVKRRDCLTHVLAQIACAAYWFNPLAWIAARHVRTERERACDDLVLACGTHGPDYADQLIEVARVMRAGRFPAVLAGASLAMAHRSQLEGRLMAILDPTVPRSGVSRMRTTMATGVFAMAVMPLASLQPWTVATAPPAPEQQAVPPAIVAERPAPTPAPQVVTESPRPAPAAVAVPEPQSSARVDRITRRATAAATLAATSVGAAVQQGLLEGVVGGIENGVVEGIAGGIADGIKGGIALDLRVGDRQRSRSSADQGKTADPRTIAALTAALKDTDKDVRETALHALVQLRDPTIFDPLVQALSDPSADVRQQAAHGLGQLKDRRAVGPLMGVVKDQSADVRQEAVFALGQLRDRSALPALTVALKDTAPDVREQAVFAIGQMKDPSSVEAIVSVLHDPKADVRQQAVFALGQIRDRRAVEPLISALKDTDADVRQQAAFGLGQIRDRAAVEALVIALKDQIADVRQQVAFALGQIRDPRAIDGLTAALKDANADVRQQAAFALGQLAKQ